MVHRMTSQSERNTVAQSQDGCIPHAEKAGELSASVRRALIEEVAYQQGNDVEEPFIIANLSHLSRQARLWKTQMPGIRPYYAVKCNPDAAVIRQLAGEGANFDCASPNEIDLVLSQGIAPSRIIFANPCKAMRATRYARQRDVHLMTFDSQAELIKIAQEYPGARLVLRLLADDETAACRLGLKFGASVVESCELLDFAYKLQLNVIGVSFHVGSGAKDVGAFERAIVDARKIWDHAQTHFPAMNLLDIGGGFTSATFRVTAPSILATLNEVFGDVKVEIISEPGRFFVEGAFTVGCSIIGQRTVRQRAHSDEPASSMLYLNEGIFGLFANCAYEGAQYVPQVLLQGSTYFPPHDFRSAELKMGMKHSIWGPSCDSADCINKSCDMPQSLEVGDWLYFTDMGAYSTACLTAFNGFSNTRKIIYVSDKKDPEPFDSGYSSDNESTESILTRN